MKQRLSRVISAALVVGTALAAVTWQAATPAAAQPQQQVVWTAQYYNNLYLSGQPVVQIIGGPNLTLFWGNGSPAPEIGADYWSARFSTNAYFEAGTYRFFIQADDEVQLWVGSVQAPKLSTFGAPRPGEMLTVDVTLNAGWQYIQLDFRENTGLASLFASWVFQQPGGPLNPPTPAPVVPPVPISSSPWLAQYYDNSSLYGLPVVTLAEADPSHNWGQSAPVAGVPADFFSARWTATLMLEGGTYRLSVYADDGVRVFIDDRLVINRFHGFVDETYTETLNLSAGVHKVVVEYFDATGPAFLDYKLERINEGTVSPTPTDRMATVTAWRLNVRSAPNPVSGAVVAQINRGSSYPVVAESSDRLWVQLNVDGTLGWVNSLYVSIDSGTVGQPGPSEPMLATTANVNLRTAPSLSSTVINVVPYRARVAIIGRNASGSWWNIRYGGQSGWISGNYAILDRQVRESDIPVTG